MTRTLTSPLARSIRAAWDREDARRGRRLRVAEVATLCGVTPRYLASVRSGARLPSAALLQDLARVLGAEEDLDQWLALLGRERLALAAADAAVRHEEEALDDDDERSGPFEPGDWLVDRRQGGDHDWGQVVGVDTDNMITVSWRGSLTTTTQPGDTLEGVEVYSSQEQARAEYERE